MRKGQMSNLTSIWSLSLILHCKGSALSSPSRSPRALLLMLWCQHPLTQLSQGFCGKHSTSQGTHNASGWRVGSTSPGYIHLCFGITIPKGAGELFTRMNVKMIICALPSDSRISKLLGREKYTLATLPDPCLQGRIDTILLPDVDRDFWMFS